jgi:hypothetical protein
MKRLLPLFVFFVWFPAAPAQGAWAVSIKDTTVAAGGTGSVDVFIQGDAGDVLDYFEIVLRITSGTSRLEFAPLQSATHLGDSAYLFAATGSANIVVGAAGSVESAPLPNDTYTASDFTFDEVPGSGSWLLARLDVTAATALAPVGGDTFQITLDESLSKTGRFATGESSLLTATGPGTVTITDTVSTVPAPGAALLMATGAITLALGQRWRRRTAAVRFAVNARGSDDV